MAKVALGKGLGALINPRVASPTPAADVGERIQQIGLERIIPTPLQPRTEFRGERLQELIDSIRVHGIIQPLIVRKSGDKFELIAGERRWRAAKEVGLLASDQDVLELALIENLQREDLNPIEEAFAFARLAREFGLKQEEIAQKVGKSRAAIANSMRLLELAAQAQSWLTQGRISVGHAKVLLSIKSHEEQILIAEMIIKHNHTVRAAEKLVTKHFSNQGTQRATRSNSSSPNSNHGLTPALLHLQNRLQQHLATHVTVQHGEKQGSIEIDYYGADDLQRILTLLGLKTDDT